MIVVHEKSARDIIADYNQSYKEYIALKDKVRDVLLRLYSIRHSKFFAVKNMVITENNTMLIYYVENGVHEKIELPMDLINGTKCVQKELIVKYNQEWQEKRRKEKIAIKDEQRRINALQMQAKKNKN